SNGQGVVDMVFTAPYHPAMAEQTHDVMKTETLAAQRILAVNEEEMQRIILDLHDGPVQQLFAAQSQLRTLQKRRERQEAVDPAEYDLLLARVSRLLEAALAEIRHFLGAFRPPDFARRDLQQILQGLFMHHELTTGCEVSFSGPETAVSPPLPVKITLYRICQEALANAYRHAGAQTQQVRLQVEDGWLSLVVEDCGKGFVPPPLHGPDATEREEHIGLRGMRDRVALVGGCFALHSAPGAGTRITVGVPYDG
ncbi:MAG: sensor histidine kinase, partial [Anaerolineales bacterium]|nr:sensor histidine kinase [Anaerolineales bacterium]